jgi:hypothetical protein
MKAHRNRIWLASAILLGGILACAALLQAQEVSNQSSQANTAFAERAGDALTHARTRIDSFFEQTSNVVCREDVSQMLIGTNGKTMYHEDSRFEYQMEASSRGGTLKLVESRESRKAAFRDPNRPLLITNGFASLLLVLHRNYASSFVFTPVAEEIVDGRATARIHFESLPGTASPVAIQLRDHNYPLPLTGEIWIDEASGAVVRLAASLQQPMDDLGLRALHSDIRYSLVQFHDPEEAYWMPSSATIDVQTPKQHWRNVHRFLEYRRFRATIQVNAGAGEGKP